MKKVCSSYPRAGEEGAPAGRLPLTGSNAKGKSASEPNSQKAIKSPDPQNRDSAAILPVSGKVTQREKVVSFHRRRKREEHERRN
jgi:hypothetical protein